MRINRFKRAAAFIAAAVILISASGCKTENKQLTMGVLSDISSAPIIMAAEQGMLPENIKLERFSSAADRDAALQSGAIDGAVSDALALAFAVNGGFDVKMTSRTEGQYRLMSAPESGISSLGDIEGKSVGLSPNTIIEYCVDLFADGKELDKQVVREMPVRMEMLLGGQLDLAAMPEPLAAACYAQGANYVGKSEDLGIDISILLFSSDSIKNKQAEIKAFYKAYDDGCAYMNGRNNALNVNDLIDLGVFAPGARDALELPEYRKAAMPAKESFETCISWMLDKGLINKSVAWQDAVTDQFVK